MALPSSKTGPGIIKERKGWKSNKWGKGREDSSLFDSFKELGEGSR